MICIRQMELDRLCVKDREQDSEITKTSIIESDKVSKRPGE